MSRQLKRPFSEEIATSPTMSPSADPALGPSPLKKHCGGGLKKSTDTVRNNARVSFKGNYVLRRRVHDIRPLAQAYKQTVSVIKVTATNKVAKASGKGVLVPPEGDFFVLNFPRMSKEAFISALSQTPQERAWIYINERGAMQMTFGEIAAAKAREENIVPGTLKIDVTMTGDARVEAQKEGTRLRPDTKLAHCVQLDFGGASQEACRYLWVETSIFSEDAPVPTSPVGNQVLHHEEEMEEVEEMEDAKEEGSEDKYADIDEKENDVVKILAEMIERGFPMNI